MRIANENGVNLDRPKGNEDPKIKVYIIPEGESTEIDYFTGIRDNSEELNIKPIIQLYPIENDETEQGQSHPKRKLENFNNSLKESKFTYESGFDRAVFVVDRDKQNFSEDQLDEFVKNCNENGYEVALSNPTFEVFLLMHDDKVLNYDRNKMYENRRTGRGKRGKRFLELEVSETFGCSKTNLDFEKFKPHIKKAIKNEKKFCEDLEGLKNELGSNVGIFLDGIIEK